MNVALAVRWLVDMNGGKPAKLTAKALKLLGVSEDACSDGLKRLESAGLVTVTRHPGQRPTVGIRQPAHPQQF
jgi:Mn-dependent DtxR family transcriptional regulator